MKAVRTDRELQWPGIDAGLRARGLELVLLPDGVAEADLAREAADADILLMCYTPVTARVIEGAARLRGIVKYGVGIDAIDVEAAKARRIPVVNVPEYAERTVAEGAFALLLALAKKITPMHEAMRRDGWLWPSAPWLGTDIAGKTLGLVGVGRIGRSMAQMAGAGFQARVLGYDPHVSAAQMRAAGVEKRDSLQAMLAECVFVSIHCVLNESTRVLIGEAEFAAMKPGAILVNVSRCLNCHTSYDIYGTIREPSNTTMIEVHQVRRDAYRVFRFSLFENSHYIRVDQPETIKEIAP